MKQRKYTILIGEDEEIERNSIYEILQDHFKTSIILLTAKNGAEMIELYQAHTPDIVLTDINMPVLNGLEAIEKMKEFQQETIYLILTSYDYFSYAQKAIQLGVNDFIVKPANANQINTVMSKAIETLRVLHNEESQANILLEKYKEMRPTMELQCLYTILSKHNEIEIQKELRKLNIQAKSGVCIVLRIKEEGKELLDKLKEDITDVGYACLKGYMNQVYVIFILSSRDLRSEDLEILEYILAHHTIHEMQIGIGTTQNSLENFYQSYVQAMHDIHLHQKDEPLCIKKTVDKKSLRENEIMTFITTLTDCFLRHDEEKLHDCVHSYVATLLLRDSDVIIKEVQFIIERLANNLEKQYQQVIDIQELPPLYVQEEQKYQNLEVQLLYILNTMFRPLKSTSYHQSNQLVKRALQYIHRNFRKPISLNDVAKELQVTPFYVSKILKQYNDKNFTDLVSECRIEEAKKSLREGQRVKEVAFTVGFQSQSYFAKTFKKIVGVTPTDYQNMFQ